MRRLRKKNRNAEVHVGPLNDILFILLLFFLIVSTMANPNVIKLTPPSSESETQAKQSIVVSIDALGSYYVGMQKISFEEIQPSLEVSKQANQAISIVINADKKVPIDQVVQVMRIAKRLGIATALAVKSSG